VRKGRRGVFSWWWLFYYARDPATKVLLASVAAIFSATTTQSGAARPDRWCGAPRSLVPIMAGRMMKMVDTSALLDPIFTELVLLVANL
jgi:hypothetical protein